MSVHKKLMEARLQMQDIPMKKSGHNKFSGYDYFKLGDFLPEAQRIFRDLGLCGVVRFGPETATLEIVDTDAPPDAERITITSPMGSAQLKGCHEVQNIGAVESYQRRYLWMAAYEIVEDDGLDATAGKPDKNETRKAKPTDGAWEAMGEEAQAYLAKLAGEAEQIFRAASPADAADFLAAQNLDSDEWAAIWTRFPSGVRSGLKKEFDKKKEGK